MFGSTDDHPRNCNSNITLSATHVAFISGNFPVNLSYHETLIYTFSMPAAYSAHQCTIAPSHCSCLTSLTNLSSIRFLSHLQKLIRLGVMPRTLKYLKLICSHSSVLCPFYAQVSTSLIALTTHNAPLIVHNKHASLYKTNTGKHAARLTQSPVAFHSPFHIENLAVREKQGKGSHMLSVMCRTSQTCKQIRPRVPDGSRNAHLSPKNTAVFGLEHSVL